MARTMTPREFAGKVDWEGGIVSALEYGLHARSLADTPDAGPLREAWAELERIYAEQLEPALRKVETLLEDLDEAGEDE